MITSFDLLGRRIMQRQEQLARNSLRTIISYSVHLILLDNYSGCQGYCADEASILVQKRNNHCCHILLDSDDGIRHAIRYFHATLAAGFITTTVVTWRDKYIFIFYFKRLNHIKKHWRNIREVLYIPKKVSFFRFTCLFFVKEF